MSAYNDFRELVDYLDWNPTDQDPRTWRYEVRGHGYECELLLFAGDELRHTEVLDGWSSHVRALHLVYAWLDYARELEPPDWEPDATRIRTRIRGPS